MYLPTISVNTHTHSVTSEYCSWRFNWKLCPDSGVYGFRGLVCKHVCQCKRYIKGKINTCTNVHLMPSLDFSGLQVESSVWTCTGVTIQTFRSTCVQSTATSIQHWIGPVQEQNVKNVALGQQLLVTSWCMPICLQNCGKADFSCVLPSRGGRPESMSSE